MDPLNKKERKKAFWKFLVFFLVAVLFLIGAVFINFHLPTKENEILKKKYARVNKELKFQTKFSKKIHEVKATLDSINQSGQNVMYLEQVVSTKLAGVKESIPHADSLQQRELYDYVIQIVLDLQESKRKLRNLEESHKLIPQYKQNVKTYKEALEQTQRDLDICRQLSQ